ncbi:MAG: hypothetical protein AABX78_02460 [Nanoarchaeota archaeon]
MRGFVIFLLVIAVMASFSFVAANISTDKKETKQETKEFEFNTFTSAVCDNSQDFVHCKDEVFVNCNGKVSKAADVAECNGIKLDVPKPTGFAVFGKDWKDPSVQ